ncbi:MAG: lysylphosphatidylglycerol synthase domain-containing protein [Desulfobacterales bacterium]|nr:lysylphosphatidylglycerol synthase domain-containing protein [Desulfobacterales bacterium]
MRSLPNLRIPIRAKTIGYLITAFALAYVAMKLHGQWQRISQQDLPLPIIAIITPGVAVYTLSFILIGIAWHHMLARLSPGTPFQISYWVFARSYIGKYLPGNFFHYAGRQLLGRMCHLPHDLLMATSTCEIFFQILTSAAIAFVGSVVLPIETEYRLGFIIALAVLLLCSILILYSRPVLKLFSDRSPRLRYLARFAQIGNIKFLAFPVLTYSLHMVGVGLLIGFIASRLATDDFRLADVVHYTVIYTISWTLGFVTPGSPGGIGVREALLTAQMSPLVGASNAVLIALCLRLAAIMGDIALFLTSFLVARPRKHP